MWKETLRDTIGNINAYFEAGFKEIIKRLYRKYGKAEAKKLTKILKTDYKSNNEIHRMVRALIPKGYSNVNNIICLDEDCYSFKDDQTNIMQVMSLYPMKRLSIPLTTKNRPKGNFKIILKDDRCELRVNNKYQVVADIPKTHEAIGVDKGYTEVFTDNTGERHGEGFGKLLTKKSDFLNEKYKNRNKLWAIMKKAKARGAYDAGSCNSGYCFGGSYTFVSTTNEYTLCGYLNRKDKVFSISAILLPDKKTLIEKYWGHNSHPYFSEILQDLGLEEEIVVDDDIG